jgi:hypothetical protein
MGKKETNKKLEFEFDNRLDNVEFDNPVESGNIESPNGSPRNGLPSPIAGDQAAEVFDTVDAGNVKTKNGSSNQLDTMVPESLIQNSSGENTESYNNWRQFLQVMSHNMHPNFAPVSDSTHTKYLVSEIHHPANLQAAKEGNGGEEVSLPSLNATSCLGVAAAGSSCPFLILLFAFVVNHARSPLATSDYEWLYST